jgi:hypothetical protein
VTVTLTDLIAAVNTETENAPVHGVASAIGDGIGLSVSLAPPGRVILDDGTFALYVEKVLDVTGTMDYSTGVYTFAAAVDAGHSIKAYCNYVYWTDLQVSMAVNAAVASLFPDFYVSEAELVATDGTSFEYTLATPNVATILEVSQVTTSSTDSYKTMKNTGYSPYLDGESYIIRFYSAPSAGTIRVREVCRPAYLAEDASVLNLPDRAQIPIVSYAGYYLLGQKAIPRVRSDITAVVTGGRQLSPRQMADAANIYYFRYQNQLAATKMFPWSTR